MSTTSPRFGRTRGGRSVWPPAVVVGIAIAASLAGLTTLAGSGERGWVLPTVVAAVALPIGLAIGWAAFVDRRTIPGATPRPEESVEGAWVDRAAQGVLFDLVTVMGVVLAVLSLVPALRETNAVSVLACLLLGAMVDVVVRYRVLARREG